MLAPREDPVSKRPSRRGRVVRLAAASLFLLATAGPAVIAEGDGTFLRYPHLDPSMQRRAAPARVERPVWRPRPDVALSLKPRVEPIFFVTVIGDSLAQMLADGLKDVFADRPDLAVKSRARDSSGLVREDYYNWLKTAREIVAGGERIDHALIMLGANDRQALREGGAALEPFTPRWKEVYGQRIEELAGLFRARNIPVLWVGLPVMRSEKLSADAVKLNELFRIHAEKAGARYVDVFEKFADETNQYNSSGPDVTGQIVRLRTADGVHFTRAGAAKLAHFTEAELRQALASAPTPSVAGQGSPRESAQIDPATLDATRLILDAVRRETEERMRGETLPGVAIPDLPVAPFLPAPRREAGPVQPLTASLASPGGELARRSSPRASPPGAADPNARLQRLLVEGRSAEPQPGRADDFAWPRP